MQETIVLGNNGLKFLGENNKTEKPKNSGTVSRSRIKLWMIRAITSILLWTCVVQLIALGEMGRPRFFKTWPSCFSHYDLSLSAKLSSVPAKVVLPPKRVYKNYGYLMVSCNGGLNQMRAAICDMVAVARYLNVTLVVPELDKTSFWNDPSEFKDIFDVDHFITSLRDKVRLLKELPPRPKRRVELGMLYSLPPMSWSDISYYHHQSKFQCLEIHLTDRGIGQKGCQVFEGKRPLSGSPSLSWDEFSSTVKESHAGLMGNPKKQVAIADKPKEEDYFYANPQECLLLLHEFGCANER